MARLMAARQWLLRFLQLHYEDHQCNFSDFCDALWATAVLNLLFQTQTHTHTQPQRSGGSQNNFTQQTSLKLDYKSGRNTIQNKAKRWAEYSRTADSVTHLVILTKCSNLGILRGKLFRPIEELKERTPKSWKKIREPMIIPSWKTKIINLN